MNKVKYIFLGMLIFSVINLYPQINRVMGMGGLTYAITDIDYSLTPYNFGGNPAWIAVDEEETFLDITPNFQNSWGNYRRMYDSEGVINYGTAFKGVKRLSAKGTFVGFTSYNYEIVRNLYRTLRKDAYTGEAYYMIDTTQGDFRYSGPVVGLTYSWEMFDDLFIGVSGTYQITDGLKQVYTNAQSIFREVSINAGLAYRLSNDFVIASNIKYSDFQETIEAKDVNLLDVEVYNYKGDTYFVGKRGSSVTQKLNKNRFEYRGQVYFKPTEKLSFAIIGNIIPEVAKVLVPQNSLIDVEEVYTDFYTIDIQAKSQYQLLENTLLGLKVGYNNKNGWSNNSKKNLLMWDWNISDFYYGLGTSYKFDFIPMLIGAEFEISSIKADSSKYIDSRFTNVSASNNRIRVGAEYELFEHHFIRAGFNYGNDEVDILYGGSDVKKLGVSVGFGFRLSSAIYVNANVQYRKVSTDYAGSLSRGGLSSFITLRLNTF